METQTGITSPSLNLGLKFEISFFKMKKKKKNLCFLNLTLAKHTLTSSVCSLL